MDHPLDQFEVVSMLHLFGTLIISSLTGFHFFIVVFIFCIFDMVVFSFGKSNKLKTLVKFFKKVIQNIFTENLPLYIQPYFAITFYLFANLFLSNYIGLVPYAFTVTSSIVVTGQLSMMHFLGVNIIGIYLWGRYLINLFLPGDTPL